MDYFKQRRAYRNFKLYETDVSNGQNNLYRELLDYANDEGKSDNEFPIKNSALLSLTGLSESGLKKARNELVQYGLIKYVKGRKNVQAPRYQIVNLYKSHSMVPSWDTRNENSSSTGVEEGTQKGTLPGTQKGTHKELTSTNQDMTNTNQKHKPASVDPELKIRKEFQTKIWAIYPKKTMFEESYGAYYEAKVEGISAETIVAGIERYKAYLKLQGTGEYYTASLKNWLQARRWTDEYDMTPPKPKNQADGRKTKQEHLPDWAQPGWTPPEQPQKTPEQQAKDDAEFMAAIKEGDTDEKLGQ